MFKVFINNNLVEIEDINNIVIVKKIDDPTNNPNFTNDVRLNFTFNENELVNTILINKNSEGTNVENYYDIAERLACE